MSPSVGLPLTVPSEVRFVQSAKAIFFGLFSSSIINLGCFVSVYLFIYLYTCIPNNIHVAHSDLWRLIKNVWSLSVSVRPSVCSCSSLSVGHVLGVEGFSILLIFVFSAYTLSWIVLDLEWWYLVYRCTNWIKKTYIYTFFKKQPGSLTYFTSLS